jgi:hypothetical protein
VILIKGSAYASELLMSLIHSPLKEGTPASENSNNL